MSYQAGDTIALNAIVLDENNAIQTDLTATIDVYLAGVEIISGAAVTPDLKGWYVYHLSDAVIGTYNYNIIFSDGRTASGDEQVFDTNANIAALVWSVTSRTLTGFGSLVADIATAVWSATTRTLTGTPGITAQEVWEYATRTITGKVELDAIPYYDLLDAYSAARPDGLPIGGIISPATTDLCRVWVSCRTKAGVNIPAITSEAYYKDYTEVNLIAYDTKKIEWTYDAAESDIAYVDVPADSFINIEITELKLRMSGYAVRDDQGTCHVSDLQASLS